jgi:hypothetical protein
VSKSSRGELLSYMWCRVSEATVQLRFARCLLRDVWWNTQTRVNPPEDCCLLDVPACSLVERYERFGPYCCPHFRGTREFRYFCVRNLNALLIGKNLKKSHFLIYA